VGPCFVVFAKELRGNKAEENSCLLEVSVGGPGAEAMSAKGAGKAVHGGWGEGGGVRAVQGGVKFVTHDFVVETRGATALVIWDVCVVIGKVKVRWDVTCGLGSKAEEGQLIRVGVQVLFTFKEVTALKVVTGNVDV